MQVYKLTSGPVIKGDVDMADKPTNQIELTYTPDGIYIWGRGDCKTPADSLLQISSNTDECHVYLVMQYVLHDDGANGNRVLHDLDRAPVMYMSVHADYGYAGTICIARQQYENMATPVVCTYRMGHIVSDGNLMSPSSESPTTVSSLDWQNINVHTFSIQNDRDALEFVFGSCRRYCRVGGITLFGTGKSADIIFTDITEKLKNADFYLSCGDQVYYDPMNNLGRCKTKKQMRKRYARVWGFPGFAQLCATNKTYMICDDHDSHCNNNNWITRMREPRVFRDGVDTYREYQHYYGPVMGMNYPLWFQYECKGNYFFVMDTRTERMITSAGAQIIGDVQMAAFTEWLQRVGDSDGIKFVVSPVPMLSQPDADSWYGFPKQLYAVLKLITRYKRVVILTGDAHCCRWGRYQIYLDGSWRGDLMEVLSSGLVAVNHDIGKPYNDVAGNLAVYDYKNAFPHTLCPYVSPTQSIRIITDEASYTYPNPGKPEGIWQRIKRIGKMVVDCCYTRVNVLPSLGKYIMMVQIYNQRGNLLHEHEFEM